MNWNILKIEETKDKKAITRAYRELLAVTNPEEKPEEFKLLREAYEEALRLADEAEQEENTEKTPVDLWLSRLESVYFDLEKRNSLPAWEELMDDELLMSLDTKPLVEDAMITFFLKNYRVPHKVWLYLNDIFGFMDKLDELYSKYPRGFVDNIIIDGVQYDNFLSFDMFSEDTDGRILDEYIGTYLQIRHDAFDNMTEQIARLKSLPAYHPYVATLILRYDQYKGEQGTVEKIESIVEGYPEDIHLLCELLVAYYEADESDKVLELAEKILSLNPDVATALRLKAYTLAKKEEYKEAVEAINKLMDLAGGDQKLLYELDEIRHEWNEKLIEQYASRLENEKDNQELVYDLIWSYILNNMNDKAEELLPLYQENYPTESKYLYVRFILAQDRQQYDEAIGFIDRMLQIEDTGEFGDTEEEKKRKSKVTDLLARKAFILSITGKKEECLEALQYGIEHHGDSPELMTRTYYTYMGLKMYKEAGECAKAVTELRPGSYHGYLLLARAYFEMFRDSEAFEAVNTAIDLDGSDLGAYLLKLRILVRNNAFEPAEQLIQFLEDEGIKDEINVKWCKAQIIGERDKDAEKALELYKEVDEEISNMEDPNEKPFWAPSFYFMMTSCLADVKDAKGDYTREDLYALLEKGIAVDPDDFDCLEYKAWLLKKDEKFEESIELYKKLEAMPRTNLYVEKQLADLYYEDVYKDGDKSLRYYEMVAEHEKDSRMYHLNVAYLYFVMKRYEESESHLLRAKEIVPEDPWVLYRFADLYLAQNRLHEALQAAQDAVQLEMKLDKEKRRAYYWVKLSQVQLRMSNPEGALKALFEGKNQAAKFDDYMDKVYDVYLKFGMWDEMEAHLREWKKMKGEAKDAASAELKYQLLSGRNERVLYLSLMNPSRFNPDVFNMVKESLNAAIKKDFSVYCKNKENALNKSLANNETEPVSEYSSYAFGLFINGEVEKAKEMAEKGEEAYKRYLTRFNMFTPVYKGSYAVCLALLGRFDEAKELVEHMTDECYCTGCSFRCCKDKYVYRTKIAIVEGKLDEAMKNIEEGMAADPSEETFITYEAYCRSRGVK